MYLSLIIPVHNAYGYVKRVLKNVLYNFDFSTGEVLIADDCSDVQTEKMLKNFVKKHSDKFLLLRNSENLGYLRTCNKALTHVRGDVVVFLNSDCEIPKMFSKRVIRCFESDENIVAASPIASSSASYYIPDFLPAKYMDSLINRRIPKYFDVSNSEGFCFCVRKSYTDKFGLFDTIYGMGYCEEVDFCFRVKSRNKRCVLIDNLYVKHACNKSFKGIREKCLSRNNAILYDKWADLIHENETKNLKNPIISVLSDVLAH